MMRSVRFCFLFLLAALTPGCSAIRFGGGPPSAQLAGGWTGYLEVEGQQILGTLTVNQKGKDLGVTFASNGLIPQASGSGRIEDGGRVTMELKYGTQCSGEMELAGEVVDQETRLQGSLSASDCTGNARGGFTFSRR